jgi:hypothetical protein
MIRRDSRHSDCRPHGSMCWRARILIGWLFVVVAQVLTVGPPATATEDVAPPRIADVQVGFDGHFKLGCWTPLEVVIEAGSERFAGEVEVVTLDGDAVPSRVQAPEGVVKVEPGQSATVRLNVKVGQHKSEVRVGLRSDGQLVAERKLHTAEPGPLAGIMNADERLAITLGSALKRDEHFEGHRVRVARLTDVEQLPIEWYGLEAVDAVIVGTGDESLGLQLSTASPRMAALDQWVRMGGTLVLCVGSGAQRVLAAGSPLAALAPGRLTGMVPLNPSGVLETFAETTEPLDAPGGRLTVQVPRLEGVRGRIEAYAGRSPRDLPLVVRRAHGFGQVVFFAFDLDRPPLDNWKGRAALFDRLWPLPAGSSSQSESGTLGEVTTLGFVDLAGQLRGALDQFVAVSVVPFWLVAALVLAYIVCAGPLDYFLVQRVLRRPELTWVTFGLMVVAFSAGAYALAYSLKGSQVRLNQVDLADYDAESRTVRGTAWANVFSPTSETYDLAIQPNTKSGATDARSIVSWLGTTGSGLGGMNPQAASLSLFTEPYDFSPRLDRMQNVPIAVWSSKAFIGRWWSESAAPIEARLSDTAVRSKLTGTLDCRLDVPLVDCVLFYDRWAYRMLRIEPGQRLDIESVDPQTIDTYLRRVRVQADRTVAPPYDRESFDVARIVEIMSAHRLAGGEKYTGLSNEHLGFVDLSRMVEIGRAVLIGRSMRPTVQITRDNAVVEPDAEGHWTFHRFVFPVDREGGG